KRPHIWPRRASLALQRPALAHSEIVSHTKQQIASGRTASSILADLHARVAVASRAPAASMAAVELQAAVVPISSPCRRSADSVAKGGAGSSPGSELFVRVNDACRST